jgi:hypothetical protein
VVGKGSNFTLVLQSGRCDTLRMGNCALGTHCYTSVPLILALIRSPSLCLM